MSEAEVRKLRDNIYGPSSDGNWDACKENWMRPKEIKWLQDNQPDAMAKKKKKRTGY